MMVLIGGDQQPLLRGILRALVIRKARPEDAVVYTIHDGDVIGKERGGERALIPHYGNGWVSWSYTFPWTPRIQQDQRVLQTLARWKFPPAHYRIEGLGAGTVIAAARFDELLLRGFEQEVQWLIGMGGSQDRGRRLLGLLRGQIGRGLRCVVQTVVDFILSEEREAPLGIESLSECLKELHLDRYSEKLPTHWRWDGNGRVGSRLPRKEFLALELSLRGRLFCTNLPYWDEVAGLAKTLGIAVSSPLSVKFHITPPLTLEELLPTSLQHLASDELLEGWTRYWSGRPSLIFAYLFRRLQEITENAVIEDGGLSL